MPKISEYIRCKGKSKPSTKNFKQSTMREPNFSESQLQQTVNTAFVRYVHEQCGGWLFAHVPSLFDEFDLGYDTAFYLPWLPHPPDAHQQGCNFFLQYKLSGILTSHGAGEWTHWGTEYFRFKIPHSTKDNSGQFIDDYHQWDRLKTLADDGYPTFYATNSTLHKDVLRRAYEAGTLLDDIPLLDVRTMVTRHKHVTFTQSSAFFLLHSEREDAAKSSFSEALKMIEKKSGTSVEASNKKLLRILKKMGEKDEAWNDDLAKIGKMPKELPAPFESWILQAQISSFIRRHLGAVLLWFPKQG